MSNLMKADKWYTKQSFSFPAFCSHPISQITASQGKNIMKIILYNGFNSRSNAMSSKYSADETEAVTAHVMNEQPENLSDYNFCLESFLWIIKTGQRRTSSVNRTKRHGWDAFDICVQVGWSSDDSMGLHNKHSVYSQSSSLSQIYNLEKVTYLVTDLQIG